MSLSFSRAARVAPAAYPVAEQERQTGAFGAYNKPGISTIDMSVGDRAEERE
jgi:hypothetical protein